MKKALILGCSHAAGAEMAHEPGVVYRDAIEFEEYGYTRSYPVLIAQALGYQALNHAIPGGSNDAMFRIFESNNLTSDDIVIACWTGFDRSEVWYEKERRWLALAHSGINVHQKQSSTIVLEGLNSGAIIKESAQYSEYAKHWAINEGNIFRGRLNKLKNIFALNALAQTRGTKVINIHSFNAVECGSFEWPIGLEDFCNWCKHRDFAHTDGGHYFQDAHAQFAEHLLDFCSGIV